MLRWKARAAVMYCSKTLEKEYNYFNRYVFGTQTPCTAIHHSLSNRVSVGRKATLYRSNYLPKIEFMYFDNPIQVSKQFLIAANSSALPGFGFLQQWARLRCFYCPMSLEFAFLL